MATIDWTTLQPLSVARAGAAPPPLGAHALLRNFLARAARAAQPVLLLINDSHRATRTRPVLCELAEMSADGRENGGDAARFGLLVATGTHAFSAEQRRAFEATTIEGSGLPLEFVEWHECDSPTLMDIGGFRFNPRLAGAAFVLAIGSVEPHYFAGLTGAHKTLTIGCLSREDIERNHAGALSPSSDVLRSDGNPVHEGICAALTALKNSGKQLLAINQVQSGAALLALEVGEPLATLAALRPAAQRVYLHCVDQPADVLHLRVPSPLGNSLYQADKALKNNHSAVRDAGGIVLEAACAEGVGPDAFLSLLRRAESYAAACRFVRQNGYRLGDHKAVKLRYLTDAAQRAVNVALVSGGVPVDLAALCGLRAMPSVAAALAWLEQVCGPLRRGLRIEDAGVVSVCRAD